jgi:LPXTG-motif cell wall-anchored protein
MSTAKLETLIWVLIYGGLLLVVFGLFVQRTLPATGWTLIVVGAIVTVVGAVLIWVRSRRKS